MKVRLPRRSVLVFEDETDLHLHPRLAPLWHEAGKQPAVLAPGQNRKGYAFGAVNFRTGRLTFALTERKRGSEFLAFCRTLLRAYPRQRVFCVLDNCGIHATEAVRAFRERHPRLVFVPLPTYSPNLNPIEPVWKHWKRWSTVNRVFPDLPALQDAFRHTGVTRLRRNRWAAVRGIVSESTEKLVGVT